MIEAADEQALELTRRGSIAFSRMERNGIRMDVPYLDRMIKETGEKIQELEAKLQQDEVFELWKKRHGSKAKIGSRKQLADVIYTGLGIECKAFTDSGTPSTDVEAFEDIDLLFVKRWANYTKLIKLRSTSLVSFRKAICNGFLRPSFNLHTTKTYRASASDPNTTNIPNREPKQSKIVRPAFIPRSEEHVILETDISGAEVRAAACYHHDPVMLDYINDPSKDMHRDMAGECYRLNPEQVSKPIRGAAKAMFVFAEFYGDWWFKVCQNMWHAVDRVKWRSL